MSREALLVCSKYAQVPLDSTLDYIGIDGGCHQLLKANIIPTLAIGDFDTLATDDYEQLLAHQVEVIKLNPIKDASDTEWAIKYLQARYDHLHIYGAIGGRIDHFLALYHFIANHEIACSIYDEQNQIDILPVGTHKIKKTHRYTSFFTMQPSVVSLSGFKYPLNQQDINAKTTYTLSNEIIADQAEVIVHSGCVVMVNANDYF